MKKIVFLLFASLAFYTNAQEIGIRFGEVSGNNVAVDGVFNINETRIHANISFGEGIGADALWDFVYKPLGSENFNWYAGIGPSMYFVDDLFLLGASGEIGIEYTFDNAPIVIGLDYRPTFWIVEETDFDFGGFGLNIRYKF